MTETILPPPVATSDAQEIEKRMRAEVRDIGIPPRPTILEQIDREMAKEEPDFGLLATLIGSDVALAAGLIKTTNSPYFGFSKKVRSVREALLVLGLKVIVRTIAGLALQKAFPHVPSLERFWDASATTARVAGWLAQHLRDVCPVRADDAYTFALFRDCGVPVMMIPFPEYPELLKRANSEENLPFTAVEDQVLALNHAIVGAELAENWLLPEDIHQAIRHHHHREALAGNQQPPLAPASRRLIAIAQLAEHLIQQHTGRNQTREWHKLGDACLAVLGLVADDLPRLLADSREVVGAAD